MPRTILPSAVVLAAFAGFPPGVARAQPAPPSRDIAEEVRGIFAARCAGCHGPDLAKPRGRFGYVLDLRRLAGNPEMVVPLHPEESELWVLVQRDEMPPADSPRGGLTPAQKEVIRAWIAAGAPDSPPLDSVSPSSRPDLTEPTPVASDPAGRLLLGLGKLHLLLVHFPIALVLAAWAGEARSLWRRDQIPSAPVHFCLWLGTLAAVPAAALGWTYAAAGAGASSPQLLTAHRWLGTAAAACLVLTAVVAERDARRGTRGRVVPLLLTAGALLTALAAHLGGLLVRGRDFFDF